MREELLKINWYVSFSTLGPTPRYFIKYLLPFADKAVLVN